MRDIVMGLIAPAALAAGLAFGAITPVHAQDSLSRALVDIADVVFNNGTPYDRYGDYGNDDRLTAGYDAYGRPVYYRQAYDGNQYNPNAYKQRAAYDRYGRPLYDPSGRRVGYARDSQNNYRNRPPYGNAYGYYSNGGRGEHCNKHGKCKSHGGGRHHDGDDEHGWNDRGWNDRGRNDDGDDDND